MSEVFQSPDFPNTYKKPFVEKTSNKTTAYNCIAWAANINTERFWPDPYGGYKWPDDIIFEESLEAFIQFYNKHDYKLSDNGQYKDGFIKIAIFTKDDVPTHAARQISENNWTSKLGDHIDVKHSLESLENGFYGDVAVFMEKRVTMFQKRMMKQN